MAAKKSSPLKIIPLGGLDGIGKNMTVFECGDDMVLVDAGLMFPDDSQPGIDLVLPDYTYVLENEEKLRGIVVTHGHEDHTGSLPYLLQDLNNKVPIFSSKLTLGFIEGKLSEFRIRAPKFREVKGRQPRQSRWHLARFLLHDALHPRRSGRVHSHQSGHRHAHGRF